jgi:phosphoglycerate dehydrogenase-like enzyme
LLENLPGSPDLVVSDRAEGLTRRAPEADVVFASLGMSDLLRDIWPLAKNVKWVHSFSAGIESLLFPDLIDSPVPVTNGRGVFAPSLGEFAIAAAFFFAKDFRRMVRSQAEGKWDQFDVEMLDGRTMGIVGYGAIGRAVGERAAAMGMTVLMNSRKSPSSSLEEVLSRSDYVAVCTPLTDETRGLVGEAEIARMKPNAVIINVGRGPVIAEQALVSALEQRRIRGAALDVFDEEPLPEGHPFYRLDNVLLSPHCADHTAGWTELAANLFVQNYKRFVSGEPLLNIVDKRSGY